LYGCFALLLAGCGPVVGEGALQVVVEAEGTITGGIPAATANAQGGFADGWSLVYERYYIDLGSVHIAATQSDTVAIPSDAAQGDRVFDLTHPGTHPFFTVTNVPAHRYDQVSYRSVPASATTTFEDTIPPADQAAMIGASTWITAVATRGSESIRIDWRFTNAFEYHDCEGPPDIPGLGTVVASGGTSTLRFTIHGDHWFWQMLGVDGSPVRFDPIAHADTNTYPYRGNGDGESSLDELSAVLLADVPPADGEFNPEGRPISTIADYMRWTTGTNGHIDGDGVCASRVLSMP
jgi:hypothetical protein